MSSASLNLCSLNGDEEIQWGFMAEMYVPHSQEDNGCEVKRLCSSLLPVQSCPSYLTHSRAMKIGNGVEEREWKDRKEGRLQHEDSALISHPIVIFENEK